MSSENNPWVRRARIAAFANITVHLLLTAALVRLVNLMMDPVKMASAGGFQFSYNVYSHSLFLVLAVVTTFTSKRLSPLILKLFFSTNLLIACWVAWIAFQMLVVG